MYREGQRERRGCTWKLGMGLAMGSQAALGFSWWRNGPLKAWEMALRLKAQTAEAAMLFLKGKRWWEASAPSLDPAASSQGTAWHRPKADEHLR